MKRDIKFRVWDLQTETMYNVIDIDFVSGVITAASDLSLNNIIQLPYDSTDFTILEQFTGAKDKNGVEGYEGDIVKYKTRSYSIGETSKDVLGVIIWDNMKCGFYIAPIHMYDYFLKGKNRSFRGEHLNLKTKEIVGNIHQNQELLN